MDAASVNVLPIWRWEEATVLGRHSPSDLPSVRTRSSASLFYYIFVLVLICWPRVTRSSCMCRGLIPSPLFQGDFSLLFIRKENESQAYDSLLWSISIAFGIEITSNKKFDQLKNAFFAKDNCAGHHELVLFTLDPPLVLRLLSR